MKRRRRYYEELRSIVEELGGNMHYVRSGRPLPGSWSAWLPGYTEKFFECNGRGFPDMDGLYVPKIPHPTSWDHYSYTLLPGARERWIAMLQKR